jgi:hypothetical protein
MHVVMLKHSKSMIFQINWVCIQLGASAVLLLLLLPPLMSWQHVLL